MIELPKYAAAEIAALNRLHRRRAPVEVELAGQRYRLRLVAGEAPAAQAEAVEFEFDGRLFWLSAGSQLREALVGHAFDGVAGAEVADEALAACLLELALEPVVSGLERRLGRKLTLRRVGAHPPPEARRCLPLRLEPLPSGLSLALALHLAPADLAVIAACFELLPPGEEAWDALPVAGACELGTTRLAVDELRRAAPGDLLLVDRQRLRERRVVLRFGSVLTFAATIEGTVVTITGGDAGGQMADQDGGAGGPEAPLRDVDAVEVTLTFQLGRLQLTLGELRTLGEGQSFDLGRDLRAPVDILAGGRLIGRGALIQIDDRVGVRVSELFAQHD